MFAIGVNLTFKERIFRLIKIFYSSLFWIVFISTLAAFIFPTALFPFGGGLGNNNNQWLSSFIGRLGLGFLLAIIGLSFLGFNIKDTYLKIIEWKEKWKERRKKIALEHEQLKKKISPLN